MASELPQPRGGESGLFIHQLPVIRASLIAQLVKNLPPMQETQVWFLVRKIHWRRDRLPSPVFLGFPCGSASKGATCNARDLGLIPGLGRSPGEGKGYPLQYFGLENSTDCIIYGVTKIQTQLSNFHFTSCHHLGKVIIWELFFFFFWNTVDLQCCVSFRYTANIYICIYINIYIHIYILFQIIFPYRLLQNTDYNSLC